MQTTSAESLESPFGTQRWELPPLILHPFSDQSGPSRLLASSKASLMLNGVLPSDSSDDELERRLLDGRVCEIRMLYFVGRDLLRWIGQSIEFVDKHDELRLAGIRDQSLAALLIYGPPDPVRRKLESWGVADYRAIFSRALALNTIFAQPPDPECFAIDFLRHYYRYCDHIFACRQQMIPFTEITSANFDFEIYASGEYARMLEKSWERE
ncbi:MAG: hypothetical protein IPM24_09455 [Bryobacterales bacterium]|nr:hypothetical protein [Bryobacterales bacterium]